MGISRKTWLMLGAAALVALVLAVPAYATLSGSAYLAWDSMGGANGTSPHGGYTTTTNKCVVCHSVHQADPFGEVLLNGSVAEACNYCHVGGLGGYTQVYGGNPVNYTADNPYGHQSWAGGPGVKCTQCHVVHGNTSAMTANVYLQQRILRVQTAWDADAGAPLAGDTNDVALTKWCAGCHDASLAVGNTYYNNGSQVSGHVMTSATAAYASPSGATVSFNGKVAWGDSNNCSSCHSNEYGTSAWPHYTAGVRFLVSAASAASATPAAATDSTEDGICLRCHVSGVGQGVGVNF